MGRRGRGVRGEHDYSSMSHTPLSLSPCVVVCYHIVVPSSLDWPLSVAVPVHPAPSSCPLTPAGVAPLSSLVLYLVTYYITSFIFSNILHH